MKTRMLNNIEITAQLTPEAWAVLTRTAECEGKTLVDTLNIAVTAVGVLSEEFAKCRQVLFPAEGESIGYSVTRNRAESPE